MFYKVTSVKPIEDYTVLIQFENGETKTYDISSLFEQFEVFKTLMYINGLFNMVQVVSGGYGIYWNNEIDVSCNDLYNNGITTNKVL